MKKFRKVISHALIVTLLAGSVIMPLNTAFAKTSDTVVTKKGDELLVRAEKGTDKTEQTKLKEQKVTDKTDDKGKQLIIKYKDQANFISKTDTLKSNVKSKLKLSKMESKKKFNGRNLEVVQIGSNDDTSKVIDELKKNPEVLYAQEDFKLTIDSIPADEKFSQQWGLSNIGQAVGSQTGIAGIDIDALRAWDITEGSSDVVVGILDSGVQINHPDLSGNIFVNTKEIPNDGLDNDGNDIVDDVNGYDFFNNDNSVYDAASDKHGTHVSGIVAGSANSKGIRGVSPRVKIIPLKFIDGNCGYTSSAISAIEYAKSMGVKIINCSWGGNDYNPALKEIMENTEILFVCASGNSSRDVTKAPVYPACFGLPNVISVSAVDNKGNLAAYSNYGTNVDVAGPGTNILSILPANSYGMLSGTSMAAPAVAGIAALLLSKDKGLTPSEIKTRITSNVVTLPNLAGKVSTGGMVSAYKALVGNSSEQSSGNSGSTQEDETISGNSNGTDSGSGSGSNTSDGSITGNDCPLTIEAKIESNNSITTKLKLSDEALPNNGVSVKISEVGKIVHSKSKTILFTQLCKTFHYQHTGK